MKDSDSILPKSTIEALARSFVKESASYGFKQVDYIRFVNVLLDYAMGEVSNKKLSANLKFKDIEKDINELVTPPLIGKNIKVRLMDKQKDRKLFEQWLSDDTGQRFLLSRITAREMKIDELLSMDVNIIGIITLLDDTPIGSIAFLNYDVNHLKAELRKLIGDTKYRGKGYAKEATKLWIKYGFCNLDLRKIYLNTFETNIRNIRLNEEVGFRVEGVLRNEVYVDGEFKDVLRMGLWRK